MILPFLAKYSKWIAGVVLVALAILFFVGRCRSDQPDAKTKADIAAAHVADSSFHAQDTASSRVDTVIKVLVKTRTQFIHDADSTQHLAETLQLADTAKQYRLRWSLALKTDTSLRLALKADTVALDSAIKDRNRWKVSATQLDSVNRSLVQDIARINGCSVLFGAIHCPTRKQAFVAGVIVTTGGYFIVKNLIRHRPSLPEFVHGTSGGIE